jgi:hypothetical protein
MPDHEAHEPLGEARERLRQALQDLHRAAGLPSSRAISAAVRKRDDLRDTVSHETVSAILRGEGVPRWVKLESLARQLADWAAHRPDPDLTVREVQELWLACQQPASQDEGAILPLEREPAVGADLASQVALEKVVTVISDEASLFYQRNTVEVTITRHLANEGLFPLREYPVKVSVDRYPEEPGKSINFYQSNPLTWSDLAFEGYCNDKPMAWAPSFERPNAKRMNLLFENEEGAFPILPEKVP